MNDFKTADTLEPPIHPEKPLAPRGLEPRTFEATALTSAPNQADKRNCLVQLGWRSTNVLEESEPFILTHCSMFYLRGSSTWAVILPEFEH